MSYQFSFINNFVDCAKKLCAKLYIGKYSGLSFNFITIESARKEDLTSSLIIHAKKL